jgi:hypothetical protein
LGARDSNHYHGQSFWQTTGNLEIKPGKTFLIELFVKQAPPTAPLNLLLQLRKASNGYNTSLTAPLRQVKK